jgi:hypothetical protein
MGACRTFTTYRAQRISVAIHTRAASEILANEQAERTGGSRGISGCVFRRARAAPPRNELAVLFTFLLMTLQAGPLNK